MSAFTPNSSKVFIKNLSILILGLQRYYFFSKYYAILYLKFVKEAGQMVSKLSFSNLA